VRKAGGPGAFSNVRAALNARALGARDHLQRRALCIPLDISDFPTRHNYVLGLWQNHIERILAGWIGELAVPVYRGREVVGFRVTVVESRPEATLRIVPWQPRFADNSR
jgi:hypothetical protein